MNPKIKVVQPSGMLDSTKASQFRAEINNMVDAGADIVLVDLKDVSFIDSSGLGALVVALKAVRTAGGKLYLCSVNEQAKMLFELTSIDQLFDIFADQEAFRAAVLT
jgi:anti-anti-sigma factor